MLTFSSGRISAPPAQFPHQMMVDGAALGPMPLQDTFDCHGHEMFPQKLVRLVGCHESEAGKHVATEGWH